MPATVPPRQRCPACSSSSSQRFFVRDINRRLSPDAFAYRRCRDCHLVFIETIPADLSRYYEGEYHAIPATVEDLERQAASEHFKVEILSSYAPGARMLEIGPSFGAFAYGAKRAGYSVSVIEMDPECCRFLREQVAVEVFEGTDPVSPIRASGPYDAIAMWQVFEHLANPWDVLRASAAALTEGGIVIIATPNPASLQHRIWGTRWTHLDAPRHLELIPLDVLQAVARGFGLEVVYSTTSDAGSLAWNTFGWVHSMTGLTTNARLKVPLALAGRLLGILFRPLERTGRRGATYTAVLRRSR